MRGEIENRSEARDTDARPATVAPAGRLARRRRERTPNAVDHYSLVLQIIQVFPIIAEFIVLVVADAWLARLLSGICLLAGTVWVIKLEGAGGVLHALRSRRARRATGSGEPRDENDTAGVLVGQYEKQQYVQQDKTVDIPATPNIIVNIRMVSPNARRTRPGGPSAIRPRRRPPRRPA